MGPIHQVITKDKVRLKDMGIFEVTASGYINSQGEVVGQIVGKTEYESAGKIVPGIHVPLRPNSHREGLYPPFLCKDANGQGREQDNKKCFFHAFNLFIISPSL